ncbi:FlhC family transcriptional regulator [Edwardsiella piscicida]|uniref:FlhC family transcriptional regulator n=1 Tax=Edwardsiella piscicida TaxID=1263550 RepID=UPI00101AC511|nr:FlhC family transcriptional regulator [Edwardsiella piscicida]QBB14602.1 regulator [Edwardsiella piscicida]
MNIGSSSILGRWVKARNMALSGYISKIITIETGLTYKQVRRLCKDLERDGFSIERKSRAVRGGATIIQSNNDKIQASILMQLYCNIGTIAIVTRSIEIAALDKVFRIYHAIRAEVPGMKGAKWTPLDITDAWCLASELRSGEGMLEECNKCKCTYYTSVNQRTSVDCPFCKESTKSADINKSIILEKECA